GDAGDRVAPQNGGVWHQFDEPEPSSQCRVEQRDRSVCGVHRADQVDVRRHPESVSADREDHPFASFVLFQNSQKLTEDARNVPTVDLVYDEEETTIRCLICVLAQPLEDAIAEPESDLAVCRRLRPVSLDKVLVPVGGVKAADSDQPALTISHDDRLLV